MEGREDGEEKKEIGGYDTIRVRYDLSSIDI